MVGAARRKSRLPRKILRVKLDDGTCQLQLQVSDYKIKEEPADYYTNENEENSSSRFYKDYPPYESPRYEHERSWNKSPVTTQYDRYYNGGEMSSSPVRYVPENKPYTPKYEKRATSHASNSVKNATPKLVGNKHQHPEPNAEFPYQCETCDMLFKSIDYLSDHQKKIHDNNRQFTCRFCSKKFNDKYNMRKHVLIHVGERRHKCQFCDKAFLRKDHLRSHLQTHYNRKYGCKSCGKGFRSIEMFERHARTHKVEPTMEIFNENGPSPSLVDSPHLDNSTKENGHQNSPDVQIACSTSLKFEKSISEDQDTNSKNSEDLSQSVPLNPADATVNDLKEEDVSVTILDEQMGDGFEWGISSTSPYRSDYSSTMAESPSSVNEEGLLKPKKYANQHTSGYKCKACNQTFDDKLKFDSHQGECAKEKWQCRKCNIVFDEVATLKQHYEQVHSVEKPQQRRSCWTCKTCVITFPNSKELSRHYAQYHKDAQMYPCSECPKTFTVWHNLKKHMLIHLGDKKHKCNICDKGFVRKDHLNSHMKVHLGDGTKYNCPICGKVFRIKDMYFKHMNLHGLEKAYTVKT